MAFTTLTTSQNEFLVSYLRGTNRALTENQARSLFGIQNLRARMSELRDEGYRVRRQPTATTGKSAYAISRRMAWQS
jgi:hypothetical protein